MFNIIRQNPRLFSDISCCGRPKICVKGEKVVLVYWFEMCITLYLYSSGCIVDGNALKEIRLWEMVKVGVSSLCMLCKEKYLVNLLVVIHQQRRQFDSLCTRDTITAHQSPNSFPLESIPTTCLQHWVPSYSTYKVFPPRFPRQPQPSMLCLEVSQTLPSFKLSGSLYREAVVSCRYVDHEQ